MKRATLSWILAALALLVGLATAARSAANRARGDELDRLERWCEAQSRRNDLQRAANEAAQWALLGQKPGPATGGATP